MGKAICFKLASKQYDEFIDVINTKNIRTVFQPIVSLEDLSVMGYEALSRGPENTEMQNPELLLKCAEECDKSFELEWLFICKALENSCHKKLGTKLFLNIDPAIISSIKFRNLFNDKCLEKYGIDFENIIFEITERNDIKNMNRFKDAINFYNSKNSKIAMDDVGSGYSGLNLLCNIKPQYLKLDNQLIRNIDKDKTKQALVTSMYDFSKVTNSILIAEGIETEDELRTLINIGIKYGQGYFIQRPSEEILEISDNIRQIIDDINIVKKKKYINNITNVYIKDIAKSKIYISPNMPVSSVDLLFKKNKDIFGLCVVEDNVVKGTITRNALYSRLGWQYGYSIYYSKPISTIMETDFLSVDYKMSIERVIKFAMARAKENIYDHVTVTKDSKYYGIVTIKDLIEKTTEIEVNNARYSNPLTGLPGNFLIEKEIEKCISHYEEYCVLYFDIDNFKAYNDVYGFENGDRIIKLLADIINRNISNRNFIGHIGGDDFISIIYSGDINNICECIIKEFDELKLVYYDEKDLKRGYIEAQNRHGIEERFPLVSISIAGITKKEVTFDSVYLLAKEASQIKKKCKQINGSCYIIVKM